MTKLYVFIHNSDWFTQLLYTTAWTKRFSDIFNLEQKYVDEFYDIMPTVLFWSCVRPKKRKKDLLSRVTRLHFYRDRRVKDRLSVLWVAQYIDDPEKVNKEKRIYY